jgi:hypothetical protein
MSSHWQSVSDSESARPQWLHRRADSKPERPSRQASPELDCLMLQLILQDCICDGHSEFKFSSTGGCTSTLRPHPPPSLSHWQFPTWIHLEIQDHTWGPNVIRVRCLNRAGSRQSPFSWTPAPLGPARWRWWGAPPTRPIPPRRRCHDIGCDITKSMISYGYDILSYWYQRCLISWVTDIRSKIIRNVYDIVGNTLWQ